MPPSIVQGLEAVADRRPDDCALIWRDTRWTYRDLVDAAHIVAASLAARAFPRGSRVALLFRNSPHYVATYYGVLLAGHVVVPLNPQERANVLARQIAHGGAAVVVGDREHPEWAPLIAVLGESGSPADLVPVRVEEGARSASSLAEDFGATSSGLRLSSPALADLATIVYTSGTTGHPKGVMLSHANLAANTAAIIEYLELTHADRGLCVLPFQFVYGNSVLHTHLTCGASLVLEDSFAFPQLVLQRLQEERVTGFCGVPSTFALLLGRSRLQSFDLSCLRYLAQAGGPMPKAMIEQLRRQLPGSRVFIMYGQTEATARISYLPPERLTDKLGSVGVPVSGVQIQVQEEGAQVPVGRIGEICVRGPSVMLGYWNDAAASAQTLRDGWLHTGDLGHFDDDGFLYIDGRAVEMIKVGAFRVSPREIEEVIAGLDGVEEVAVTGMADPILGQAVKAVIVPREGATLDPLAVKARCLRDLAAYKVPRLVEFAVSLPRTASGKIQRLKLA